MHWNIDPVIVFLGPIELRYYGVCFALGLLLCAWRAPYNFDEWRLPREHAERVTLWVPVGMLLGAHYIHLLFYETEGLFDFPHAVGSGVGSGECSFGTGLSNTVGGWFGATPSSDCHVVLGRFFGLGSGLASHGGGLGCVLALVLFWHLHGRKLGLRFHHYADAVMVTSIWVYPFVRLGNFFNSEIIGRPTDSIFGVIFDRYGYQEPRHPVVLYEAAFYFAELALATWLQKRYARKLRAGVFFYGLLMTHFTLRFIAEFFKESQGVDEGWPYHLNMGHALSAPIVLGCAFMIFGTKRFNVLAPLTEAEIAEREAIEAAWLARGGPGGPAEMPPAVEGEPAAAEAGAAGPKKKRKKAKKAAT